MKKSTMTILVVLACLSISSVVFAGAWEGTPTGSSVFVTFSSTTAQGSTPGASSLTWCKPTATAGVITNEGLQATSAQMTSMDNVQGRLALGTKPGHSTAELVEQIAPTYLIGHTKDNFANAGWPWITYLGNPAYNAKGGVVAVAGGTQYVTAGFSEGYGDGRNHMAIGSLTADMGFSGSTYAITNEIFPNALAKSMAGYQVGGGEYVIKSSTNGSLYEYDVAGGLLTSVGSQAINKTFAAMGVGDFDNDGIKNDLLALNNADMTLSWYKITGATSMTLQQQWLASDLGVGALTYFGNQLAIGDPVGDGKNRLVLGANNGTEGKVLFMSYSSGTLANEYVWNIGNNQLEGVAIDTVPEPATMALLLTGGLALLRKRRA